MLTFKLYKPDPHDSSRFVVEGAGLLHLRSRYQVSVSARDFAGSGDATALLSLHARDDSLLAASFLEPDPMRRDVRTGTLNLAGAETVRRFLDIRECSHRIPGSAFPRFVTVRLIVTLDGDTVVSGEIDVEFMPLQYGDVPGQEPGGDVPDQEPEDDTGLVDRDGVFYLPVFKRDGVQVYRRMCEFVDECGASVQVSGDCYVKSSDGDFTVLEVPDE